MEWVEPKAEINERCENCVYNLQGNCIMPTLKDVSLRFVLCAPKYDVIEDAEEVAAAAWYGWEYEEGEQEEPSTDNDFVTPWLFAVGSWATLAMIAYLGIPLWTRTS